MGWLDLHMHSDVSNDGEFSPKKLMELCFENNVKVAALADHNSVRGVKDAKFYANKLGIQLIPAIELDCTFRGVDLHVLGYGIDETKNVFNKIEESVETMEREASKKRIDLIKKLGIEFDYDELMKLARNGVITGEMIAEVALKDDKNKDNPLMKPFYPSGSRDDNPYVNFYWDICARGKEAYVPIEFMNLSKALELIYNSGGIPILAHPGNNVKEDEELLHNIIQSGILGIEVYSSYHSKKQIEFYEKQAEKYNLIKTIGSDFHGKTKPTIKLGGIEYEKLDELYEVFIEKLKH